MDRDLSSGYCYPHTFRATGSSDDSSENFSVLVAGARVCWRYLTLPSGNDGLDFKTKIFKLEIFKQKL